MAPKLGFEAAGGMVEKFLPGVNFSVLINAVLPGVVAAVAVFPRIAARVPAIFSLEIEKIWPKLVLYALVVIAWGGLVSALNSEFYKLYEGRTYWPRRLKERAIARQQQRVERLYAKAEAEKGVNEQEYNEIWYQLRVYPINTAGKRYAAFPTLLGNILFGYEDYPRDRYGMDSIFYWPRLWLTVSKENREEVGKSWAVADGLLNLSAVSLLAAILWALLATAYNFGLLDGSYLPITYDPGLTYLAALGWAAVAYFVYRLSLPFHRNNGEVFKALFDLYREKLTIMTELAPGEAERWRAAWAYLQYLRIRCGNCKAYVSIYDAVCGNCGAPVSAMLDELRRTGHLVAEPTPATGKKGCREVVRDLLKAVSSGEGGETK